jgi:hypothetical protein
MTTDGKEPAGCPWAALRRHWRYNGQGNELAALRRKCYLSLGSAFQDKYHLALRAKENFSSGFDIVSSEASGVPEVYNPDRFLRRHP